MAEAYGDHRRRRQPAPLAQINPQITQITQKNRDQRQLLGTSVSGRETERVLVPTDDTPPHYFVISAHHKRHRFWVKPMLFGKNSRGERF